MEADKRMLYHVASLPSPANVVLRTYDADVLCIALGIRKQLSCDHHIWLEVGHYTDNTLRYIDVDKIHDTLGESVCNALPALHVFSGSDYTTAFNKKGKTRPLKLLKDNIDMQNVFSALGSEENVDTTIQDVIELFVCLWYSQPKKVNKLADARLNCFLRSYTTKKNAFQSVKGCDASLMPLCQPVLLQKIKRTNLVMSIWKYAHLSTPPTILDPERNGWTLIANKYCPKWFDGEMSPSDIHSIPREDDVAADDIIYPSDTDDETDTEEIITTFFLLYNIL